MSLSLKSRTIKYNNGEVSAEIKVSVANVLGGLQRSEAMDRVASSRSKFPTALAYSMSWLYFPVIKGATVGGSITVQPEEDEETGITPPPVIIDPVDLTIDQFLRDIPDALMIQWTGRIMELNPHWVYGSEEKDSESPEGKD
jgi:hypothetical protein